MLSLMGQRQALKKNQINQSINQTLTADLVPLRAAGASLHRTRRHRHGQGVVDVTDAT